MTMYRYVNLKLKPIEEGYDGWKAHQCKLNIEYIFLFLVKDL